MSYLYYKSTPAQNLIKNSFTLIVLPVEVLEIFCNEANVGLSIKVIRLLHNGLEEKYDTWHGDNDKTLFFYTYSPL
jgi:hypothetical protein